MFLADYLGPERHCGARRVNLKMRVLRLERLQNQHLNGKITIDVLDRVLNGTISEEEFARCVPFWEEILADHETTRKDP
jgi:hypothetical protein